MLVNIRYDYNYCWVCLKLYCWDGDKILNMFEVKRLWCFNGIILYIYRGGFCFVLFFCLLVYNDLI